MRTRLAVSKRKEGRSPLKKWESTYHGNKSQVAIATDTNLDDYTLILFHFFWVRIIGQRWKNIDPDRLSRFSELAAEDTERYKTEMTTYNARQESKMRNELKPPQVAYPGLGMAGPGSMDRGGPPSQQVYAPSASMYGSHGGYDPAYGMGAPGSMAGYGGYSEYSGYGMGMSGYGMPESAAYGGAYGQPMEAPPGSYGGGGYSMGGMMGGGYQGGMMVYDQYGQPIDGSIPPGAPGPYSSYPPQGGWGQG
jgi:hypothetical protein